MLRGITIKAKIYRGKDVTDEDIISAVSPGEYSVAGCTLDFTNSKCEVDNDLLTIYHWGLDTFVDPDSKNLTRDQIRDGEFTEFYIYIDDDLEDTYIERLLSVEFDFDDDKDLRFNIRHENWETLLAIEKLVLEECGKQARTHKS